MNHRIGQTGYKSDIDELSKSTDDNIKISKSSKQLDELLRAREIQKNKQKNMAKFQSTFNKNYLESDETISRSIPESTQPDSGEEPTYTQPRINYGKIGKNINNSKNMLSQYNQYMPFNCQIPQNQQINCYTNIWDAYWPFIGSAETDTKLNIELDYLTFNGILIEKWSTSLPTPPTNTFPSKDLFKFNLVSSSEEFDFDIKFENITSGPPTILNVSPISIVSPLNVNQFLLVRDPGIHVTTPATDNTNVLGIIGYYNSNELYLNNFTQNIDSFENVKNIFMSTQLFFMHINQIKDNVKLTITHNTNLGENLFKVFFETNSKVEIKETQIPVKVNNSDPNAIPSNLDIVINTRTVYINSKYFMTYATYGNDISAAQQIVNTVGNLTDPRQTPIQLASMLLFGANVPLSNLDSVVCNTDHERTIVKLYRDILKKL